jgi:hypothetical protein
MFSKRWVHVSTQGFELTSSRLRDKSSDQMASYPDASLSLGRVLYNINYGEIVDTI